MSQVTVLCIGDVMLDRFVYGSVDRISPEAPIPVLHVEREKHMLGGAGNVAANIAALGAKPVMIAAVGNDSAAEEIRQQLATLQVDASLQVLHDRATTVKSRFIGGQQQILRVDREKCDEIAGDIETAVIAEIGRKAVTANAIILSDYGKGLLTKAVTIAAIAAGHRHGIPVIVDPKGIDFSKYRGASFVTPNRKELEAATSMKAGNDIDVRAAAMKIVTQCGIPGVLATRGKDGMALVTESGAPLYIAAQVREVFDVSGAGDTVIATFATALAAGAIAEQAAEIANVAAGIAVGKPGTATVRPEEITMAQTVSIGDGMQSKVMSVRQAAEQAEKWRARGFKVGFTNGCFDLLHPGHLKTIQQAKNACDYLIVAANSDASVKRLKGPSRPVQDENARAMILAALSMVDGVVLFEEDTPVNLLKAIKPDVLVKGGQYKLEEVVGYDIVMGYGGKIVRADMEEGFSTTNTIQKMTA